MNEAAQSVLARITRASWMLALAPLGGWETERCFL